MGYPAPGERAPIQMTPELLSRLLGFKDPSIWPAFLAARMGLTAVQDFAMKVIQWHSISEMKRHLPLMLEAGLDVAREQALAGPTGDVSALRDDLKRFAEGLNDNWAAGIFEGMGGAYSGYMDDFLHTGQLLYAYKTLAYHTAVTPRMRRHWLSQFTPMVPDSVMAWYLYRRGHFTRTQFDTHAAYDGWSKAGADLLVKSMEALPTPHEAFYLWAKGQITQAQRDALYWAGGWDTRWHAMITENLYYTPTLYDLTRIADYVELDQIWALDAMKRRGVKDADRAKIWEMLEVRPLRDEVRLLTTHGTFCRRYGLWNSLQLDEWLRDLAAVKYIRPKEKELLTTYAENLYETELKLEWIEILRWRFRTAVISEEEFREGLTDPKGPVAMVEEKANLIVELEKAKGYYGYY